MRIKASTLLFITILMMAACILGIIWMFNPPEVHVSQVSEPIVTTETQQIVTYTCPNCHSIVSEYAERCELCNTPLKDSSGQRIK